MSNSIPSSVGPASYFQNSQVKEFVFEDPNHDNALRTITLHENGVMMITGKDSPNGKLWEVRGVVDKDNQVTIDFSSKGGPKDIKATFYPPTRLEFSDGNTWKALGLYS